MVIIGAVPAYALVLHDHSVATTSQEYVRLKQTTLAHDGLDLDHVFAWLERYHYRKDML